MYAQVSVLVVMEFAKERVDKSERSAADNQGLVVSIHM